MSAAGQASRKIRVAAIQLRATDDREANIRRAGELIDEAAAAGARLILLPEIFSAPFVAPLPDPEYFRWAEAVDGPSNAMAAERSAIYGITIVSPIFEQGRMPGVFHNSACTFVDGKLVSLYRKSHLPFSNGFPEKFYFRPGDEAPPVVDTGTASVGTIICYERHFPELSRVVALRGAEVLCIPVACASAPTKEQFTLELRAHAVFNHLYVVCANRVGLEGDKRYYGLSTVIAPDGTVLASAEGEDEGVVSAEVDLGAVAARRTVLPFFRDRRPALYGDITSADAGIPPVAP